MSKIVFEHYPASKLPEDMRKNLDTSSIVTVELTIEESAPSKTPTLEEIFARRLPPFRTVQDIDQDLRRDRDEWDD